MNVRPFSVSRKQSRRLTSWLITPSKHHPDGPSHRAACSVLRATYVQHESCNMHQCSMQHTTVQHAAHNMPHRPFDVQHDLCMHSAPCNPRQGTRPHARHAALVFNPAGRPTDGPAHRRLQARHQQGTATAGDLGGRARRGLRIRGVHPPSLPVRCCVPCQSQRLARLAAGREGRAAHV